MLSDISIHWPLSLCLIVWEHFFWAENERNEMLSNGLLFSAAITYLAKVQAAATQTHTRSRPQPLNSRICVYIDQSQLPVKCYARLDTSRYQA